MPSPNAPAWRIGPDQAITLDRPRLMAILNVTPDSFSDGGRHATVDAALDAAARFIDDGAVIIDVGGESTRPGAARVSDDEQIRRVVPVIGAIARRHEVVLSVDTTRAPVAAAAIDAGARIINDVAAGTEDESMFALAARERTGLVIMHRRCPPAEDVFSHEYARAPDYGGDVVGAVARFLDERVCAAIASGVAPDAIVVDPGLGFGKSVEQNLELIARFDGGERPVLGASSRKSFIGAVTGVERPSDRVAGSVAASLLLWTRGVRVFRVHDVRAHRDALAVAAAVIAASRPVADGDSGSV